MRNKPHKKKVPKLLKAKRNKTGPDEKKAKLEDVHQTALSFLTTSDNLNYHDFVKMNMNSSFKRFDNNYMDKLKNLGKQGNSLLYDYE